MATRLYFQASGSIAAPNNPAFDSGWEQTGQAVRLPMPRKAGLVAMTALANSSTITVPITTTQQILCYQFVSDDVFPPTRLGSDVTVSMVMRCSENATTNNVFLAYVLRAFSADGQRSLGTLSSSMTNAGTEFAVTASVATRTFAATALTATTLSEGWRLVLELGGHAQGPTASGSYVLRAGTNGASDFALTSGLTTDLNSWVELSADFAAQSVSHYQSVRAGGGISVTERVR